MGSASNDFVHTSGPAIDLQSCRNVIVEHNRIENNNPPKLGNPLSSVIRLARSSNIVVEDNLWEGAHNSKPGVTFDPTITKFVTQQGNDLLVRAKSPSPLAAPRAPD